MTKVTDKAQSKTVALFVSDVHLQASLPKTTAAFLGFLNQHARATQQLYLMGDLFEYWAGDDDITSPHQQQIVAAIRAVSDAGVEVLWLPGNRDFLVGPEFAKEAGLQFLSDPYVTTIANQPIVLTHGDAQCTDDHGYMAFRAQVRNPQWQQQFLAQPLSQRKAIIEGMRSGSRDAQREKTYEIMDVNNAAIATLFEQTGAMTLIHGHTHRPGTHEHRIGGTTRRRHVLADWDCDCASARGGWLRLDADGSFWRVSLDGSALPA